MSKKCRTVGDLISELQKLNPKAKLAEPVQVIKFNDGQTAKELGLKPVIGLETD